MTNEQIIFNNRMELMKEGIIGTTGKNIVIEDEEGRKKYGIAGISCLYYREGSFAVRVSSRTYDMAPLRVVFGIVFVTFFEGCELRP